MTDAEYVYVKEAALKELASGAKGIWGGAKRILGSITGANARATTAAAKTSREAILRAMESMRAAGRPELIEQMGMKPALESMSRIYRQGVLKPTGLGYARTGMDLASKPLLWLSDWASRIGRIGVR
jgi:hypothetical protein